MFIFCARLACLPGRRKAQQEGRDNELAYLRACVIDNVGSVRRILRTKHYLLFSLIGETAVAVIAKRDLILIIFFFSLPTLSVWSFDAGQ